VRLCAAGSSAGANVSNASANEPPRPHVRLRAVESASCESAEAMASDWIQIASSNSLPARREASARAGSAEPALTRDEDRPPADPVTSRNQPGAWSSCCVPGWSTNERQARRKAKSRAYHGGIATELDVRPEVRCLPIEELALLRGELGVAAGVLEVVANSGKLLPYRGQLLLGVAARLIRVHGRASVVGRQIALRAKPLLQAG
jgi:hypothetical protein